MKFFVPCDAKIDYVLNVLPYVGKQKDLEKNQNLGALGTIAEQLVQL